MKKLIALVCAMALAFSLAACGGKPEPAPVPSSSSAPPPSSSEPAPPPPSSSEASEVSPYEQAKQDIIDNIDVAYTGLTATKAPMYFLASNDGEFTALIMENPDGERYCRFIGSSTIDSNGVVTVKDSDTGNTFGFTAEKQTNGSFFLDCGNIGECYLQPDDPGKVVDNIFKTFSTMTDATQDLIDSLAYLSVLDYVDYAFSGITAMNAPMYFLLSEDGSYAALVLESSDGQGYIKFIGSASLEENGMLTVTDSDTGNTFTFSVEVQEDGTYFLDCGNLGQCYLIDDEPEPVLDCILTVLQNKTDVTDALIEAVG